MSEESKLAGPDFLQGVPLTEITEGGMLFGHAAGEPVLLARSGREVFAIGAECTHYRGPLAEGLRIGDTVRCPRAPRLLQPAHGRAATGAGARSGRVLAGRAARGGGTVFVHDKLAPARGAARAATRGQPESVVIIGGGAAGQAAAEMLRREGYIGPVTMLSAESERPYDRPNLSKDYLAGNTPEEWLPLRPTEFTPNTRSCSPSAHAPWPSMPRPAKYSRRRNPASLGRAAARHRRRADPPRYPRVRAPACPHPAQRKRLPRSDRRGAGGAARGRDRCQLYRARGRGVVTCARTRRRHRGPRDAPDGSRIWGRDRRAGTPGP